MGQRPRELTPSASPRHFWGAELRARRNERGLSLNELSKLVHRDGSYLAKIERGDRNIPADLARDCDKVLNAGGMLVRLHAVVSEGGDRPESLQVANDTSLLVSSERLTPPIVEDGTISLPVRTADGRVIFVRISRRLFLGGVGGAAAGIVSQPTSRAVTPPLRGSSDVNPLEHFIEMKKVLMDSDNFFGPARVISTVRQQIEIMQSLRESWRGEDRQRLLQVETQYADLLGWLYQDSRDFQTARQWVDRSLEWSHMACDNQTTAFILARRSQLAADMGDSADAIDVAEAAVKIARPDTRTAAIAATFAGHGHALGGDSDSSSRAYDEARELLSRVADDQSAYGLFFNEGYLDVQRAHSLLALGRFLPAAEVFQTAIEGLPGGYWRDRGVYLAWEACAYAEGREAEQAANLGLDALAVAWDTGSARITSELTRLDGLLRQWAAVPEVEEFRAALADIIPHQS